MNKKLRISLITVAILLLIGISVTSCMAILPKADMKPSDYDLGLTLEQASKENKPVLTVFYVDWCTYCKRFMPKLDKIRNINKKNLNVVLLNVEDPENEKISKEYRIAGFPTVYIIDPKYDNRVHIDSGYLETVDTLNKEVQRYLNFRKLAEQGASCQK